jgi:DNA-binding CsgD family transcriptional regulator
MNRKFIVVDVTHTIVTKRQHDVLRLANDGKNRKQIARELGIGTETVKTHLERAYRLMGATNARQACAIARAAGLLS